MVLILGDDRFALKKQLNKIIDKIRDLENDNDLEIIKYSLIDHNFEQVKTEVLTFSLFDTKKIIVLEDAYFLTEKAVKLHSNFDLKFIEKLITTKSTQNEVIFTLPELKISKKLKIAKLFADNVKVVSTPVIQERDIREIIQTIVTNANKSITLTAIDYLINNLPNNLEVINNEINKIINLNHENINLEMIKDVITRYVTADTFELTNAFLQKNIKKFIIEFNNYRKINNDLNGFMALLSSSLVLFQSIKILKNNGLTNGEISKRLELNPYRVSKLLEIKNININQVNDIIKSVYTITKFLRMGKYDNKIIPEIMLLNSLSKIGG